MGNFDCGDITSGNECHYQFGLNGVCHWGGSTCDNPNNEMPLCTDLTPFQCTYVQENFNSCLEGCDERIENFSLFNYQENDSGEAFIYVSPDELGGEIEEPDIYNQIIRIEGGIRYNLTGFSLPLQDGNEPYDFQTIIDNSFYSDEEATTIAQLPDGMEIIYMGFDMDSNQESGFVTLGVTEIPVDICDENGESPGSGTSPCNPIENWSATTDFKTGFGYGIYIPEGTLYLKWGVGEE